MHVVEVSEPPVTVQGCPPRVTVDNADPSPVPLMVRTDPEADTLETIGEEAAR